MTVPRARRSFLLLLTISVALLAAPQAANADKPRTGCPPGFNLGAWGFEESLELPHLQAGLADGIYTLEDLQAGFETIDMNEDDLICLQEHPGLSKANPASLLQYFYNAVDNNASKP